MNLYAIHAAHAPGGEVQLCLAGTTAEALDEALVVARDDAAHGL